MMVTQPSDTAGELTVITKSTGPLKANKAAAQFLKEVKHFNQEKVTTGLVKAFDLYDHLKKSAHGTTPSIMVIDCRTVAEFEAGHIDGALNFPLKLPDGDVTFNRIGSDPTGGTTGPLIEGTDEHTQPNPKSLVLHYTKHPYITQLVFYCSEDQVRSLALAFWYKSNDNAAEKRVMVLFGGLQGWIHAGGEVIEPLEPESPIIEEAEDAKAQELTEAVDDQGKPVADESNTLDSQHISAAALESQKISPDSLATPQLSDDNTTANDEAPTQSNDSQAPSNTAQNPSSDDQASASTDALPDSEASEDSTQLDNSQAPSQISQKPSSHDQASGGEQKSEYEPKLPVLSPSSSLRRSNAVKVSPPKGAAAKVVNDNEDDGDFSQQQEHIFTPNNGQDSGNTTTDPPSNVLSPATAVHQDTAASDSNSVEDDVKIDTPQTNGDMTTDDPSEDQANEEVQKSQPSGEEPSSTTTSDGTKDIQKTTEPQQNGFHDDHALSDPLNTAKGNDIGNSDNAEIASGNSGPHLSKEDTIEYANPNGELKEQHQKENQLESQEKEAHEEKRHHDESSFKENKTQSERLERHHDERPEDNKGRLHEDRQDQGSSRDQRPNDLEPRAIESSSPGSTVDRSPSKRLIPPFRGFRSSMHRRSGDMKGMASPRLDGGMASPRFEEEREKAERDYRRATDIPTHEPWSAESMMKGPVDRIERVDEWKEEREKHKDEDEGREHREDSREHERAEEMGEDRREGKSEERTSEKENSQRDIPKEERKEKRSAREDREKREIEAMDGDRGERREGSDNEGSFPHEAVNEEVLSGDRGIRERFGEDEAVQHAAAELRRAEEAMEKAKAELRHAEEKAHQRRNDEILKGARRREPGLDSNSALCENCKSVQAHHLEAQPIRISTQNESRGGETYLLLRLEKSGTDENIAAWKFSA